MSQKKSYLHANDDSDLLISMFSGSGSTCSARLDYVVLCKGMLKTFKGLHNIEPACKCRRLTKHGPDSHARSTICQCTFLFDPQICENSHS